MKTQNVTVEIKAVDRFREALTGVHCKRPSIKAVWVWQKYSFMLPPGKAAQLVGGYHAHAVFGKLNEFKLGLSGNDYNFIQNYEAALEPSAIDKAMQIAVHDMMKRTDRMLLADLIAPPAKRTTFVPDWGQEA